MNSCGIEPRASNTQCNNTRYITADKHWRRSLAEHSEALKNQTQPRAIWVSALRDMEEVRPDWLVSFSNERRFPHQPGYSLEPVKEVMEIQSAPVLHPPADSWFLLRFDSSAPNPGAASSVGSGLRAFCAGCVIFSFSAMGHLR